MMQLGQAAPQAAPDVEEKVRRQTGAMGAGHAAMITRWRGAAVGFTPGGQLSAGLRSAWCPGSTQRRPNMSARPVAAITPRPVCAAGPQVAPAEPQALCRQAEVRLCAGGEGADASRCARGGGGGSRGFGGGGAVAAAVLQRCRLCPPVLCPCCRARAAHHPRPWRHVLAQI
jgi:hypothetical protein